MLKTMDREKFEELKAMGLTTTNKYAYISTNVDNENDIIWAKRINKENINDPIVELCIIPRQKESFF